MPDNPSLSTVKAVYATAHEPQAATRRVVAVSPPRLSYTQFCSSPEGPRSLEDYARAEAEMGAGRPDALLDVRLPLPFVVTAAGYVEKYGPDERYDYVPLPRGFPCPVLVTLGAKEVEGNMAFRGAPEALAGLRGRHAVAVVPGADHSYTGARDELLAQVESWPRVPD